MPLGVAEDEVVAEGIRAVYTGIYHMGSVWVVTRDDPNAAGERAKLFWNGRSQAVRLPKAFRFEGASEVAIRREGDKVILEPVERPHGWPPGYWERLRELTKDFEFPEVEPLPPGPERPGLDEL